MVRFFRRFIGTLVLDAAAFEEVEADRGADLQSVLVVLAVCLAGGVAAMGLGLVGLAGFLTGAIVMLGGWVVWVGIIASIGTTTLAEPDTKSDAHEMLRVLGYAAAPGVFVVFAAMQAVAAVVIAIVSVWMIAAAVMAVRQALDYRSTARAAAVCVISFLVSVGFIFTIAMIFSRTVG
jgi:hypothetical protein